MIKGAGAEFTVIGVAIGKAWARIAASVPLILLQRGEWTQLPRKPREE